MALGVWSGPPGSGRWEGVGRNLRVAPELEPLGWCREAPQAHRFLLARNLAEVASLKAARRCVEISEECVD